MSISQPISHGASHQINPTATRPLTGAAKVAIQPRPRSIAHTTSPATATARLPNQSGERPFGDLVGRLVASVSRLLRKGPGYCTAPGAVTEALF